MKENGAEKTERGEINYIKRVRLMTGRINGRNGRNLKRNKKMKVRTNEKEKFKRERKEQQEIVNDLSKKKQKNNLQ